MRKVKAEDLKVGDRIEVPDDKQDRDGEVVAVEAVDREGEPAMMVELELEGGAFVTRVRAPDFEFSVVD